MRRSVRDDIKKIKRKMDKLSRQIREKRLQDSSMQDDIYRKPFEKYSQPASFSKKDKIYWKLAKIIGWILLALVLGLLSAK